MKSLYKVIILLLITGIGVACYQNVKVSINITNKEISVAFLEQFALSHGAKQYFLPDMKYTLLSHMDIAKLLISWEKVLKENNLVWKKSFDCDDFATKFRLHAQEMFQDSIDTDGLAVFRWGYTSPLGGHMINVILTQDDIIFIEPQTGKILSLHIGLFNRIIYFGD